MKRIATMMIMAAVLAWGSALMGAEEPKKDETIKEEVKKEEPKKEESAVPDWVKNIKFKGDFRFRYQYQNYEDAVKDDTLERNRLRYRARIGLEAKVNDWAKIHFGVASGSYESKITADQLAGDSDVKASLGQDLRSTNQTFDDFFSHKPLWIDYAYAEFTPWSWLTLTGGKMKNPFHTTSELIWDGDITPEGAALQFKYAVMDELSLLANAGIFILDEVKALDDPMMAVLQIGAALKVSDFDATATLSYYDPMNLMNAEANTGEGSKMRDYVSQGYYWKNIAAALDASYTIEKKYQIGLLGEVTANLYGLNKEALGAKADDNLAFFVGLKGGTKALANLGDFQSSISYRQLGISSWIPFLIDADPLDGNVNAEGIKFDIKAGLYKNFSVAATLNYFWTLDKAFNKDKTNKDLILQLDLNYKF
ncbi:MAG TPA: putative porin [bacterium]|nr:putative porin [bacterium]